MTAVAVCALTFRRAKGLARLLEAMDGVTVPEGVDSRLIIVDNDADGSARAQVDAHAARSERKTEYVVQPMPGIPAARNAAVAAAAGADWVVFVDDDEIPARNWLAELLEVQAQSGADVVTGPVIPLFDRPPPGWIVRGGFFERPRFATGQQIDWATTSNVLISSALLARPDPFNLAMQRTGGSDTHFFMRAVMEGARIVWADGALVSETIPVSRADARWLVRREYRRGNTLSICLRDLCDTPWRRARRLVNAGLQILTGVVLLPRALVLGRAGLVSALQRGAFGAGMITGLYGLRFEEYTVIHGS